MDELYYCGFNGFRQVPSHPDKQTLTSLIAQSRPSVVSKCIHDVAICWNYLVVAEDESLIKYGLVNGKNGQTRIGLPPGAQSVRQISATPRHILAVTDDGGCWAFEESKGWRFVTIGRESSPEEDGDKAGSILDILSDGGCSNTEGPMQEKWEENSDGTEKDKNISGNESQMTTLTLSPSHLQLNNEDPEIERGQNSVKLLKTSCGDAHNIGLDSDGRAYSLPSPLDFNPYPGGDGSHKVTDVVCGKEHCLLLTEHGQVFSWGGGSRGQLGHGNLFSEEKPRLVMALDGMRIRKVAAGGWHSACISYSDDLYMFGWNESGQLAQPTNLAKPAECFSAVEKLFMACCTMQPEDDAALPRGSPELDCEVYHKNNEDSVSTVSSASMSFCGVSVGGPSGGLQLPSLFSGHNGGNSESSSTNLHPTTSDPRHDLSFEKDSTTCYSSASCNGDSSDLITVQSLPMLVSLPSSVTSGDLHIADVGCGSRHTVVLTRNNQLWSFGWNKYGQLGIGHNHSRDAPEKMSIPRVVAGKSIKMLKCGDWGTAIVTTATQTR